VAAAPSATGIAVVFTPGIDGTGRCGQRQWKRLQHFVDSIDVITMEQDDRSSYEEVVAFTLEALRERRAAGMRTVLVGESLGAVVCLGAALAEPDLVDGMALFNPATSIDQTWVELAGNLVADFLPDEIYRSLPALVTPLFGTVGWFEGITGQPSPPIDAQLPAALLALSQKLGDTLPSATLKHRLRVLADGSRRVASRLDAAKAAGGAAWPWARRTALVATSRDLVLPSVRETERLAALMPGARRCVVEGPGHVCLDDDRVNLLQLLDAASIFELGNGARALAAADAAAAAAAAAASAAAGAAGAVTAPAAEKRPVIARAGPRGGGMPEVKVTNPSELAGSRLDQIEGAARLASPVFLSRGADGTIERGVHAVPMPHEVGNRPVLFVGNHQLFGIDGPLIVREILNERGVLVKALVYPPLMGRGYGAGADPEAAAAQSPLYPLPYPPAGTAEVFEIYGAQPVSARALVTLLSKKEAVLIFPGGAREVFKRRGEEYKLFWPEVPDLMRIAAKYDAIVVPFSGIGSDELGDLIADSDELLKLPLIGDWFKRRIEPLPSLVKDDLFVPPLVLPRLDRGIPRHYFLLGTPIDTLTIDRADDAAVGAAWAALRASVEDGLALLQRKRAEDPYVDFFKRSAYEQLTEGRQAPSWL
jgi:pimeloyl-ACP methyl ester carboxylesterase